MMIHWQPLKRLFMAVLIVFPLCGTSVVPEELLIVSRKENTEQLAGMAEIRSEKLSAFISSCRVSLISVGVAVCSLLLFELLYLYSVVLNFHSTGSAWLKHRLPRRHKTTMKQVLTTIDLYLPFSPGVHAWQGLHFGQDVAQVLGVQSFAAASLHKYGFRHLQVGFCKQLHNLFFPQGLQLIEVHGIAFLQQHLVGL